MHLKNVILTDSHILFLWRPSVSYNAMSAPDYTGPFVQVRKGTVVKLRHPTRLAESNNLTFSGFV